MIDVCNVISGKTPKGIDNFTKNDEIPFFKVGDMNRTENSIFMEKSELNLSHDEIKKLRLSIVDPGTVLFPKRGGSIYTNKKRILNKPACYDLNIMGINPILIPVKFVYYWLQGIDLKKLSDGSTVPQINHTDIEPLKFPLPSYEEINQIVEILEQKFPLIENAEKITDSMLKELDDLRFSILKQAFEGKLVPQNNNDEPVISLLEKIKEKEKH